MYSIRMIVSLSFDGSETSIILEDNTNASLVYRWVLSLKDTAKAFTS